MGDRPDGGVSELNPLAEVRQARMAGIIWDEGFARVTDLAGRFGVSAVTVRADLTALEARARVRRVRGGAVPPSGLLGERPFESSQWEAPLQKSSIGVHAAGMIAAGDTVILDVGTTTTAIARALVLRTELHDVTVVTNGLNIALEHRVHERTNRWAIETEFGLEVLGMHELERTRLEQFLATQ